MLDESGTDNVEIISAGIGTLDGYPATNFAVEVAKQMGADISDHHSSRMTDQLAGDVDLILAMADSHYDYLSRYSDSGDKLFLLRAFPESGHADFAHSVADPIGGTLQDYQKTAELIALELKRILPELLSRIREKNTAD